MLLFQTQAAISASRAMIAESQRDWAYSQKVRADGRRAIEESDRLMTEASSDITTRCYRLS